MKDVLVSILMPTFNVEKYIDEAVESLLCQTYSNIEIIIVDDCSTDNTFLHLERLASIDSRIKLLKNSENCKIVKSLNKALSVAKGEFIARMDGDDISTDDRIETLLRYLSLHPEYDLVGSYSVAIDSNGYELARRQLPITDKWVKRTLRWCSTIQHIWMARREVYDLLGGYRDFPGAEDYDFLLRAKKASFVLGNCPEYLYKVRLREGNTESTEGLRRVKTKEFVYNNSLIDDNIANEPIDTKKFLEFIELKELEAKKYREASKLLNKAKHERNNKAAMIKDVLQSAIKSRYMMRYLFEVSLVRIASQFDRKNESKGI